jgi:hypothetical protein
MATHLKGSCQSCSVGLALEKHRSHGPQKRCIERDAMGCTEGEAASSVSGDNSEHGRRVMT